MDAYLSPVFLLILFQHFALSLFVIDCSFHFRHFTQYIWQLQVLWRRYCAHCEDATGKQCSSDECDGGEQGQVGGSNVAMNWGGGGYSGGVLRR